MKLGYPLLSFRFSPAFLWRVGQHCVLVVTLAFLCACGDDECLTTRDYFEQELWGPIFSSKCLQCHGPGGIAEQQGADLKLLPSSFPGFLDANVVNVTEVARLEADGESRLVLKARGELSHGGGAVIQKGSREEADLRTFVQMLREPPSCGGSANRVSFRGLEQRSAGETLRKATLTLVGRLPTDEEQQAVREGGMDALSNTLDTLMNEEAFYSRLKELFNDVFLTDRYLGRTNAINLLNETDYPNAGAAFFDLLDEATQRRVNNAVAREPLELVVHVVRENRPFSEVLTAPYTVLNPDTARVYGVPISFANPADPNEFHEAVVHVQRDGGAVPIPHAGVLTSPMFLSRFPTTPTNLQRHRARTVFRIFLGTDLLKVAERPIDAFAATAYNNPTRDDPSCSVCHRMLDPVAGGFLVWDSRQQDRYVPNATWPPEFFAPGFGRETMPTTEFSRAPSWLAERVASDPRFPLAITYIVYRGFTGREPLTYPANGASEELAAWRAQDAMLRSLAETFVEANLNLKVLIRELFLSPLYRAKATRRESSELQAFGTERLATPEHLSRKIRAVVGVDWSSALLSDYRILYGGIDSSEVTERLRVPNGVMANVAQRMANAVSCYATAWDFLKPVENRLLFPFVLATQTPELETGEQDTAAIKGIRDNIRHLHARVLGEELEDDDPELERTYRLFYETWKAGREAVLTNAEPKSLPGSCRGKRNPLTNEELPSGMDRDEHYVVRAWMAVLTYLLSDYRFLYE